MVISTRSAKTTAGNPFFSEVLHAITAKAEEVGFDVILQTSRSTEDDLQKCESKIKQKLIKGIIMLSSPADESFLQGWINTTYRSWLLERLKAITPMSIL